MAVRDTLAMVEAGEAIGADTEANIRSAGVDRHISLILEQEEGDQQQPLIDIIAEKRATGRKTVTSGRQRKEVVQVLSVDRRNFPFWPRNERRHPRWGG